ncbi:Uncharacterised protein [Vibrio cholerae]|nr:Uncharacterised protein [Vibrio cholerae]
MSEVINSRGFKVAKVDHIIDVLQRIHLSPCDHDFRDHREIF